MKNTPQKFFITGFNAFTVVLFAWFVFEFLARGSFHVPGALAEIYLLILVFYAGDKEMHRWHHRYRSRNRRGEFFVYAWTMLGIVTYTMEQFAGRIHRWVVPSDLGLVVWSVIVIFIITEFLKTEYHGK